MRVKSIRSLLRALWRKFRNSGLSIQLFGPNQLTQWLNNYLPTKEMLEDFRGTKWPLDRPRFSIIMPVYNVKLDWLKEAVQSVQNQTYADWELFCVDDASPNPDIAPFLKKVERDDPRVHAVLQKENQGVSIATNAGLNLASGSHIIFMDHDDYLEPHALHRFAAAILDSDADVLYADEAIAFKSLDRIIQIKSCPAFSHDYYMSHPYLVHPVCVKASLVKSIGGLDPSMTISHDVDMFLRLIEKAQTIAHVPDVLYRWRIHPSSASRQESLLKTQNATVNAIRRHLERLEMTAEVCPSPFAHNFFRVDYPLKSETKVAVVIPTKNHAALLERCLQSLRKTAHSELFDIIIIDHESDDAKTRKLLKNESGACTIVPYSGKFNFSAMINLGVRSLPKGRYSQYLFLNNDVIALENGWMEHMAGLAQRPEVGAVGAMLLYPDRTIQHAGVICGLAGPADHSHKFHDHGMIGVNGSLYAIRDYSAVTAACMMVSSKAFDAVNGFDESLEVGFNDLDFCLRLRQKGFKILQTPYAVLIHLESQSRRMDTSHPEDTKRLVERYADFIEEGDPFYSPYLDRKGFNHLPDPKVRCPKDVKVRVQRQPF